MVGRTDSPEEKKKKHLEMLEYCGVLKRYQNITFDRIKEIGLPKEVKEQYRIAKAYADEVERNIHFGNGLIFAGPYGSLKTTLATAILRQYLDIREYGGMFVPMVSLIDNLYKMRTGDKEEAAKYEAKLRTVPLLVLDDLGGENTDQAWIRSKVDAIITERYNRVLPVIATTNMNGELLSEVYGGRIVDRLRQTCKFVVFPAKSFRGVLNNEGY